MLRDLEAGGRIEADHILGFLLEAAKAAGVPHELHEAAYIHAKAYEQRRDAGACRGRPRANSDQVGSPDRSNLLDQTARSNAAAA